MTQMDMLGKRVNQISIVLYSNEPCHRSGLVILHIHRPHAWYCQIANPVIAGTTYLGREHPVPDPKIR
jgi:hypothetical protein